MSFISTTLASTNLLASGGTTAFLASGWIPQTVVIVGYPVAPVTFTVIPTGGDTVTIPNARERLIGPPSSGAANYVGHFLLQAAITATAQTANTYRWVEDTPYYTTSPAGYSYAGNTFRSLGGL